MSVSGISSSNLLSYMTQSVQNNRQKMQQQFQQLGQDLQSGNLSAAQSDFAALQQLSPQTSSTSSTQSGNSIGQDFTQLAQDLKAGNTTAAQQDYTKIQQDFQSTVARPHHHHHSSSGSGESINQLLQELGQSLQAGNLSSAQQAYASLQQEFTQFAQTNAVSQATSSNLSLSV